MTLSKYKEYIISKSKEIGIDIVGFTNANEFEELRNFLELRRKKQYQTEFEELDIEKRISPKKILETGKSIIVIGVPYYIDTIDSNGHRDYNLKGKLSKSSLGLDYHIILKDKMEKLIESIKEEYDDFEYATGVDTTPLIDRYLAKKSGVGWYGKNSNIINDRYGSFIFIGYIITNLEIEEDLEAIEKCEDCEICIRSCPVGAIKQNYELNARRCISYLTQTKNEISYELRDKMAKSMYGCDICQLVCPKNIEMIANSKKTLNSQEISEYIDIEELFQMSNKNFKQKYGHIAFSWRGKNIIKRNGIITIGNSKKMENMKFLEFALNDENIMIRKYVAWALLKIDKKIGIEILEKQKVYEKDLLLKKEVEKLKKYFEIY